MAHLYALGSIVSTLHLQFTILMLMHHFEVLTLGTPLEGHSHSFFWQLWAGGIVSKTLITGDHFLFPIQKPNTRLIIM